MSEEQNAIFIQRQKYLEFWLRIDAVKPKARIYLVKDSSVDCVVNGIMLKEEMIAVSQLQTPIATLEDAKIRKKLNNDCVDLAIKAAFGLSAQINHYSSFDRKHYVYHDLPAGYQITQFFNPIATNGSVHLTQFDGLEYQKTVNISQIQLEMDSGKSITDISGTFVDLNRAGVGVLEIVTEPDINTIDEALALLKKVVRILSHYDVGYSDMDQGAYRCDFNISVHKPGNKLGERTELKHIAKFGSVKQCLQYEIDRQIKLLEQGQEVVQETRGVDLATGTTFKLRDKEAAKDYRFMPEPDIPPIQLSAEYISKIKDSLPEPLDKICERLINLYKLSKKTITTLMNEPHAANFFENVIGDRDPVKVSNWIIGELFGQMKSRNLNFTTLNLKHEHFGELLDLVHEGLVSGLRAKDILSLMIDGNKASPKDIAVSNGWIQQNDLENLEGLLKNLIERNPDLVSKIKSGNTRLIKFFVGEVMKETKGKSNPKIVLQVATELLKV